ncbi:cupin domain-containing protein [Natrialba aegyptia]|uniref:Cupin 2 barrel domain-containing protein n=1 Tax=Natrialba aegyptia DSM 13077 TaxID=1227491 RepID=M0BB16_9EURY|nr:cupin domain-containing protein [Natrialba aegyptia]ELZ07483.1 cupin 2 barrel domain-containing protein [Natrialba aegyptia DSM 13077]
MQHIVIDAVDVPPTNSPADVVRPISEALGTSGVAINYFELAPGESFGFAYHRHHDQEEVFFVLTGTATFRTEMGEVRVGAGEVIRFEPGEFQRGTNHSSNRVTALALGAPRDSEDIEYLLDCTECSEETIHTSAVADDRAAVIIRCTACETETRQPITE